MPSSVIAAGAASYFAALLALGLGREERDLLHKVATRIRLQRP